MLRILLIDDDPRSVEDVVLLLHEKFGGLQECTMNFEEGKESIRSFRPDIIMLDIWKGPPQLADPAGSNILNEIWDQQFCPVIVYSADSQAVEQVTVYDHPLVAVINKGSGSDERVLEAVTGFAPYVKSVRLGEENIRIAFFKTMRDVAPYAFRNFEDQQQRADTILRAGRRRVAALMDEPLVDETNLPAWEQYLCPPVSKDLQLGDILRLADGQSGDPAAFRLVLTPSCDLVASDGRKAKVEDVLVAKCSSMKEGLRRIGIHKEFEDSLSKSLLSQGYSGPIIPFPSLQGRIPTMTANLRNLELIPIEQIVGANDPKYSIVASIDSPFRELVSWAYLQISCRPGLPDRDLPRWMQEIIQDIEA